MRACSHAIQNPAYRLADAYLRASGAIPPGARQALASVHLLELKGAEMSKQVVIVLYVVAMAALIVGVDFAFFRNRFWERLIVNIGIVLVFGAFYCRFLSRP